MESAAVSVVGEEKVTAGDGAMSSLAEVEADVDVPTAAPSSAMASTMSVGVEAPSMYTVAFSSVTEPWLLRTKMNTHRAPRPGRVAGGPAVGEAGVEAAFVAAVIVARLNVSYRPPAVARLRRPARWRVLVEEEVHEHPGDEVGVVPHRKVLLAVKDGDAAVRVSPARGRSCGDPRLDCRYRPAGGWECQSRRKHQRRAAMRS
jgi:hypothetical protein